MVAAHDGPHAGIRTRRAAAAPWKRRLGARLLRSSSRPSTAHARSATSKPCSSKESVPLKRNKHRHAWPYSAPATGRDQPDDEGGASGEAPPRWLLGREGAWSAMCCTEPTSTVSISSGLESSSTSYVASSDAIAFHPAGESARGAAKRLNGPHAVRAGCFTTSASSMRRRRRPSSGSSSCLAKRSARTAMQAPISAIGRWRTSRRACQSTSRLSPARARTMTLSSAAWVGTGRACRLQLCRRHNLRRHRAARRAVSRRRRAGCHQSCARSADEVARARARGGRGTRFVCPGHACGSRSVLTGSACATGAPALSSSCTATRCVVMHDDDLVESRPSAVTRSSPRVGTRRTDTKR